MVSQPGQRKADRSSVIDSAGVGGRCNSTGTQQGVTPLLPDPSTNMLKRDKKMQSNQAIPSQAKSNRPQAKSSRVSLAGRRGAGRPGPTDPVWHGSRQGHTAGHCCGQSHRGLSGATRLRPVTTGKTAATALSWRVTWAAAGRHSSAESADRVSPYGGVKLFDHGCDAADGRVITGGASSVNRRQAPTIPSHRESSGVDPTQRATAAQPCLHFLGQG